MPQDATGITGLYSGPDSSDVTQKRLRSQLCFCSILVLTHR